MNLEKVYNFLSKYSVWICIGWLAIWFVMFYPTKFVNADEFNYVGNAYHLLSGSLHQPCSNFVGLFANGDFCVSKYNIGTSVVLIPAVLVNGGLVFATSFIIFCVSILLFADILKRLNLPSIFLYLFAFFPAFVYYSRTAMSETFTLFFVLAVLWGMIRFDLSRRYEWLLLSGVAAGMTILVRYTAVFPLVVLFGWYLIQEFKLVPAFKKGVVIGIGILPFLIIFVLTNIYLYGAPFRSGYYFSGEETLSTTNLVPMLLRYILALNVIYPGMLLLPLLFKFKYKWLLLPVFTTITVYSLSLNSLFEGRILDLILGIRFMVPFIPLLLIANMQWWQQFQAWKWFKLVMIIVIMGLAIGVCAISIVHQDFLSTVNANWPELSINKV